MSRALHLRLVLLAFAGPVLLGGCRAARSGPDADASRSARRPDIVVLLTDDAGYADFGFTGATDGATPAIDALAARGAVCTQAYVTASVCSPSRAGMLSGRYQQRVGHEFNGNQLKEGEGEWGFPGEAALLPELLKPAGYRTVYLGKWHLGALPEHHPNANGVDEFVGLLGGSRSYRAAPRAGRAQRLERNGAPLDEDSPELADLYLTDLLADEAVRALEAAGDEPLLLFVSFTGVHTPMHARDPALDPKGPEGRTHEGRRPTERAMMRAVDEGVGRVLAALRPNTLVVFTNDNGGATNNGSDNGALRGMKGSKWEGGIRVPFIVAWDGVVPAGSTFAPPVSTLDIAATALAAAGALPAPEPLDGVDLAPFLRGERDDAAPHERLFWRRGVASAVREGDWKLIRVEGNPDILVNLARDPGETTNLADREPARVAALAAHLAEWERDMVPARNIESEVYRRNQIRKHRMDTVGREAERSMP
jgi:arylsulfatase A-like enzyme